MSLSPTAPPPPLLEALGIKKSFGQTHALTGVDFCLARGEILCLIGENGAGKSTLMKILSGTVIPDDGTLRFKGVDFRPRHPLDSRRAGIAMVYQELSLAPHLSVAENLFLGMEPTLFWGVIDQRHVIKKASAALEEVGLSPGLVDRPVSELPLAHRQMVEIARALLWEPEILVLDEPTSSLGENEIKRLFDVIGQIKKKSISMIYISHFLEECLTIGDRYLVMRDGASVDTGLIRDTTENDLISLMVGRSVGDAYPRTPHDIGAPILKVDQITGQDKPRQVSFELCQGEILGIAGLVGAGRTETLRAIMGLDKIRDGFVEYSGQKDNHPDPPRQIKKGFGFLSENRKEEGLMIQSSIQDNILLSSWGQFARGGVVDFPDACEKAKSNAALLNTKYSSLDAPVSTLSGGNQQKIALARLLAQNARIYLLDEPTRGVDINSKIEIYKLIGLLAAEGKSIILVSSYLPELFGICDTLCVMNRGRLSAKKQIADWTPHSVIEEASS